MTIGTSLSWLARLALTTSIAAVAVTAPLAPAVADDWHHHWRNADGWQGHDRSSFAVFVGPGYTPYPYDTPPPVYYVRPRLYYTPARPAPYYIPAPYPRPSVSFSIRVD
jgi:hypothetical protein